MKKIQYFKLFESRTARLSDEEFINLAKTKCKDFLTSPKYLQRIKASYDGDYSYINPKLSHRNPLMKDEGAGGVFSSHHTLLMDNLPSWKGFPKRTQSIIGSTNFGFDPSFGDHYYCIIPYDGAKFAVAPDCDLWNSSCKISNNEYKFDDYFSESFSQASISDDTYEDMMNDIQKLITNADDIGDLKSLARERIKIRIWKNQKVYSMWDKYDPSYEDAIKDSLKAIGENYQDYKYDNEYEEYENFPDADTFFVKSLSDAEKEEMMKAEMEKRAAERALADRMSWSNFR
jgi:hypothetical protein